MKKIREIVPVPTNPAVERANVVNVLPIIGIWASFRDVCSLPRWRELTTVRLKNLLKHIGKLVYRISYFVYREEENINV